MQSISYSLLCKYFRDSVLPLDEKLMLELLPQVNTKRCEICGREYLPRGRNTRFCPDCAKKRIRKKARERMRQNRQKKQEP